MPMITENFSYGEFKPSDAPEDWMPYNDYQKILVDNLAKNLQIIRSSLPSNASMKITSGVRTAEDYNRLVSKGYHPSETSDHYCGNVVKIEPASKNFKKFGTQYFFSVGAADIVPSVVDTQYLFKLGVNMTMKGLCKFGQVILENDPAKNVSWVHFSNDAGSFFSPDIVKFLGREKFLITNDGGKTYNVYKP